MEPYELTVSAAAEALRARDLSPVDLVDSVLLRIERVEPRTGAYVAVVSESVRREAEEAEREIAATGPRGPLHGIPMALKDVIDAEGLPTSASSRVRDGHRASANSTVAARLSRAGAILLGKTHTHEFAYGLTTPQTHNAWDERRVAGGSSGGSAVAVATGTAVFALGTDTGGSIRVPAALNGVVGLKPTYGLVPRTGVTSLSWSLDHVGPVTRSVQDAALVLEALAGPDPGDPASLPVVPGRYAPGAGEDLVGMRVGVPRNYYFDHVAPDVEEAVRDGIAALRDLGAQIVDVEVPMTRHVQAVQWGLMVPEASAAHAQTLRTTPELYGSDVRALLEAGELVLAGDYVRAQRARTLMRDRWLELFTHVDIIVAPSVPAPAATAGQDGLRWPDGSTEAVSDAYVRLSAPANITGFPALTVPAGLDREGLPIGMQFMGRPLDEAGVLRAGAAFERVTPFGLGRIAPGAAA
ncbi:amidase [Streptomyces sp. NPDC001941]|uniref:amidase n=1 Tax=Streptomyces sp. NPDC001941 TaxID=3154659 RepID=UPI003332F22C